MILITFTEDPAKEVKIDDLGDRRTEGLERAHGEARDSDCRQVDAAMAGTLRRRVESYALNSLPTEGV